MVADYALAEMPRACPVEFSRSMLHSYEREPPRDKPVASKRDFLRLAYSGNRDAPRGKPVASISEGTWHLFPRGHGICFRGDLASVSEGTWHLFPRGPGIYRVRPWRRALATASDLVWTWSLS
jgi:hypothetical protein